MAGTIDISVCKTCYERDGIVSIPKIDFFDMRARTIVCCTCGEVLEIFVQDRKVIKNY